MCGFRSAVPCFHNHRSVGFFPAHGNGTTRYVEQHNRFAGFQKSFEKIALHVGHFKIGSALALTSHVGQLTECGNNHIAVLSHLNGFLNHVFGRT